MKNFITIARRYPDVFIFVLVLCVGFLLRLNHFNHIYRADMDEVARDYLVAHHIVAYHEYPLVGPHNSVYNHLKNSPLYYYFIAFPLLIYDSIYTHAVLNVVLQLITILAYYALAYVLFGRKVALLAGILFLVSYSYFIQIEYLWQPFVVETFISVSYLTLALGHSRKKYYLVCLSIFFYVFSFGLGLHAIPLLPVYLFVLMLVMRRLRISFVETSLPFSLMIMLLFIIFLPVGVYSLITHQPFFLTEDNIYIQTLAKFGIHFVQNINIYWKNIVYSPLLSNEWNTMIYILFGFVTILYFFRRSNRKVLTHLLIVSIFWLLSISSILNREIYDYHYIVVKGLSLIVLSEVIVSLLSLPKVGKLLFFLLAISLIMLVSVDPAFLSRKIQGKQPERSLALVVEPLAQNIYEFVKEDPKYLEKFSIQIYIPDWGQTHGNPVFWNALETRLHTKLTKVTNDKPNNYLPLNKSDEYIYLMCEGFENETTTNTGCIQKYLEKFNSYRIEKKLYKGSRWRIYLTKQYAT